MQALQLCQEVFPEALQYKHSNRIGYGSDGEVFDLIDKPNVVIKFCAIFEDSEEKEFAAINILQQLIIQPLSFYAQPFFFSYLGRYKEHILYFYTMEKLLSLSEDEQKVFHTLLSHEDRNLVKNYSPAERQVILQNLRRGLDFDEGRVSLFVDKLNNSPVQHLDIHTRNIMKDANGNFKMIDLDRLTMENT
jgi:hypothetical protein